MAQTVNSNPIEHAFTLASSYYVDPALLEQEKRSIFWRTWQIVGCSGQVAKAGDYFTADLCGEPLLLVRDTAAQLRGFYNVCRHRAGPPAEGCGSRNYIHTKSFMYREPGAWQMLLEKLSTVLVEFAAQQVDAGADVA